MTELFTGRPKIIVEPPQNTEPRGTYDLNTALQNISFSGADKEGIELQGHDLSKG